MRLKVHKLKGAIFSSVVVERYRRREESVEEALIDMYLADASTRQVDDVSQLLWDDRMPLQKTLSDKLKRVYADIAHGGNVLWPRIIRTRSCGRRVTRALLWGGAVENVSVLVAIGVGTDCRKEVLAVAEDMKEREDGADSSPAGSRVG